MAARSISPWKDVYGTGEDGREALTKDLKFKLYSTPARFHNLTTSALARASSVIEEIQFHVLLCRDTSGRSAKYTWHYLAIPKGEIRVDFLETAKQILKLFLGNLAPYCQCEEFVSIPHIRESLEEVPIYAHNLMTILEARA